MVGILRRITPKSSSSSVLCYKTSVFSVVGINWNVWATVYFSEWFVNLNYIKKTLKITSYFSFWPSGKYTEYVHRSIKRLLTDILKHYFCRFFLTNKSVSPNWMIETEVFPFLFYQGRWKWLEQILSSVPSIVLLSWAFNRLAVSAHTLGQPLISSGSYRPPVCSERWGEVERDFWDWYSIASCYHVCYFS